MNKLLLFLAVLSGIHAHAQSSYDSGQLSQWQQEGDWDRILIAARSVERPDLRLLNAAGFAAYQTGDRQEAQHWFDGSLALDSGGRGALYYAALIQRAEGHEQAAIPLLQRLCRQAPDISAYQQLLGDCYAESDQVPAAVDAYRRAFRLSSGSVPLATKLASALQAAKLYDQADTLLRSAMLRHPGTPAIINASILLAYARKQYARCATLCDSLIATGRMNYRALQSGLYADIARTDFRHAVMIGDVLIAMDAVTEEVLYYKAIAHQKLGEWKTADTLLLQCVRKILKPELKDAYLALAEGAEAQGNFLRSRSCYDTAYYLFKNPEILYRAGRMLEAHGMQAQARPVYKRYLALPPGRQDTAISRYLKQRLGSGE